MIIRPTTASDTGGILRLYRRVAAVPGGLARLASEIDEDYVSGFVAKSLENGIALVAERSAEGIIGEIHASTAGLYCFSHVLSDLTIAVDPVAQGSGVGRSLFQSLLDRVIDERPDIKRVELVARESNRKALRFYESLGFCREGSLAGRIRNIDGSYECDIPMGWQRPTDAGAAVDSTIRSASRSEAPHDAERRYQRQPVRFPARERAIRQQ